MHAISGNKRRKAGVFTPGSVVSRDGRVSNVRPGYGNNHRVAKRSVWFDHDQSGEGEIGPQVGNRVIVVEFGNHTTNSSQPRRPPGEDLPLSALNVNLENVNRLDTMPRHDVFQS